MKNNTKYILTIILVVCFISTATVQVIAKPIETSENIKSENLTPEKNGEKRRWLVFGIGFRGDHNDYGLYFKPAYIFGSVHGDGIPLIRYLDLDDIIFGRGRLPVKTIWKNAEPYGAFRSEFIGHMGLRTIFGIYNVEIFEH